MVEIAIVRIYSSGKGFDLKFYNPSQNLSETFANFLLFHQQTGTITCNFSWREEDTLRASGYEARANSVEHSKELYLLVRRYCQQFQIRLSTDYMKVTTADDSENEPT